MGVSTRGIGGRRWRLRSKRHSAGAALKNILITAWTGCTPGYRRRTEDRWLSGAHRDSAGLDRHVGEAREGLD